MNLQKKKMLKCRGHLASIYPKNPRKNINGEVVADNKVSAPRRNHKWFRLVSRLAQFPANLRNFTQSFSTESWTVPLERGWTKHDRSETTASCNHQAAEGNDRDPAVVIKWGRERTLQHSESEPGFHKRLISCWKRWIKAMPVTQTRIVAPDVAWSRDIMRWTSTSLVTGLSGPGRSDADTILDIGTSSSDRARKSKWISRHFDAGFNKSLTVIAH